jgi:c-di-GMP-binding flagellar brake protein YcgR
MAQPFVEKRIFPRIALHAPLRYWIRGIPVPRNTVTEDISLGGIGFSNQEFIAPEACLMLEVNLLSRVLRPIGKVVWTASLAYSDRYRMGIEFLEVNQQDKEYLAGYINMQIDNVQP